MTEKLLTENLYYKIIKLELFHFQVTLYSMMSSDRREDPGCGLLLYLKEPSMKVIPADHVNQKGNIMFSGSGVCVVVVGVGVGGGGGVG